MKSFILITFFIALIYSCTNSNTKEVFTISKETEVVKLIKKIETIDDYLFFGKKSYAKKINDVLREHVNVENASIFMKESTGEVFLVLKLLKSVDEAICKQFKIIA